MSIKDLYVKLQELGISEDNYYLHGLFGTHSDEDRISLNIKRGVLTVEYEVYFKERGTVHSTITFTNEGEACQYIFNFFAGSKGNV